MKKTLKTFIRQFLTEAAVGASSAASEGYALFMTDDFIGHSYVLYNPSFYLDALAERKQKKELNQKDVDVVLSLSGGVVGAIFTDKNKEGPCYDSSIIAGSSAIKGYGPLMYDIAMTYSPGKTLSPDRDTVSKTAHSVWKYYYDNRADVDKKKFDNIENPKTPPKEDDCPVFQNPQRPELNYAYTAKGGVNISGLVSNHIDFLDKLEELTGIQGLKNTTRESFMKAGNSFFAGKYKEQRG